MRLFWFILYNLILYPLFFILTVLLIPFNKKIRDGFIGRLRTRKKLVDFKNNTSFSEIYWFHVSSHGEFQQIQSIIEEIKIDKNNPLNELEFKNLGGVKICETSLMTKTLMMNYDPRKVGQNEIENVFQKWECNPGKYSYQKLY